jgi:cytosine/adenosine deaminase-related metal-dependent hydrolase
MLSRPAISFSNARLSGVDATTLRVSGGRILSVGEPPSAGDTVIDCHADWLLPGFINAHDHLELNNFDRLKWRERYDNSREWIADFQPRFDSDPAVRVPMAAPLDDRLFIGGLKNLLCGATTVAHHNPLYAALKRRDFPVRVVQHYGWSHSLLIDGETKVAASYGQTRKNHPWLIHLSEGVDAEAAGELARLDALGALQSNTLIVHGVGLTDAGMSLLRARGAGLVWCPSSNLFMLGRTADVRALSAAGRVALGSDSRLSGERDLLDEMHIARSAGGLVDCSILKMVGSDAARLLRLSQVGTLQPGAYADLVVMPEGESALGPAHNNKAGGFRRADVRLVLLSGRARYADTAYASLFAATRIHAEPVWVDGRAKLLEHALVRRLRGCSVGEQGLAL